jgi:hypothetical protein
MWTKLAVSLVLGLALGAAGCDDTTSPPPPTDGGGGGGQDSSGAVLSFQNDIAKIFMTYKCKSCHNPGDAGMAPGGLDLTMAFANLVDQASTECSAKKRVAKGSPANSYLLDKLTGMQATCGKGARMPKNGPPYLTDAEIATVTTWISQGANP